MPPSAAALRGLYVVLDADVTPDLPALLDAVLAGGARVVQYRAKRGIDAGLAGRLAASTRAAGGLFIVNDDLDVALAIPDAGLHLGQEDLAARDAERVRDVASRRVVGISCGIPDEARRAERFGAAYVGVGPVAATATKSDAGAAIGEAGLRAVASAVGIPTVAIGGLTLASLPLVVRAGAAMAAVVTAIARDPDPRGATARFVAAWPRGAA